MAEKPEEHMSRQTAKQRMYLTAESIYRFLKGLDKDLDTLILCNPGSAHLVTTDQSLYEALGSISDRNEVDLNKLVKLMEVTEVISFAASMKRARTILTENRVSEISSSGQALERQEKNNKK